MNQSGYISGDTTAAVRDSSRMRIVSLLTFFA